MTTDITTTHSTSPSAPPEVEGTFELKDYIAQELHLWDRRHTRWPTLLGRGVLLVLVAVFALLILLFFEVVRLEWASGRLSLGDGLAGVGITLFLIALMGWVTWMVWKDSSIEGRRRLIRRGARWKAQVLIWLGQVQFGCRWRLSLFPEEFIDVVEHEQWAGVPMRAHFEYRIPWDTIQAIDLTENYLFLCLTGKHIIPIPRRWFPDDASFEHYAGTAREYWLGARRACDTPYDTGPPPDPEAIRPDKR